jgi:spore germination protein KB
LERLGKYQICAGIILFLIGSIPLFVTGIEAGRDAWLVMLTGMLAGLFFVWVYLYIQHNEPESSLIQIIRKHFGKYIGTVIAILYVLHFAYQAMRNTRDFGDLIVLTLMPESPLFLIMLIMMIISTYAVYQGTEVFFRTLEILFPIVIISFFTLILFFFLSGVLNFQLLLPVLENGLMPVLKAAVPNVVMTPFAQIAVFLMFWKYLNNKKYLTKYTLIAYIFTGLFLVLYNILIVAIIGAPLASISTIPLLRAVPLIQIGGFLERLDPIFVIVLVLCLYTKMTVFYLGAVLALAELLNKSHRKVFLLVGAVIYGASFIPANYIEHIWVGFQISHNYDFVLFQAVIPVILLLIIMVKKKSSKQKNGLSQT